MSSKRTTRAGTRRLSKASSTTAASAATSEGGKGGGRQLSITQMLLRHTEQLSINEGADEHPVANRRCSITTEGIVDSTSCNNGHDSGNNDNNNSKASRNRNLDPAAAATTTTDERLGAAASSSAESSAAASRQRRKRRASDSLPEEADSFAGAKRRQTLAVASGWIPLTAQTEIAR